MRNSIICIILAFLIIISLGYTELMYLKNITNELVNDINNLEYAMDKKDEKFNEFKEKWNKYQKILSTLIDHQDIHKIESVLVEIDTNLKNNFSSSQISTNFARLKLYIRDIVDEREFNFKNVL